MCLKYVFQLNRRFSTSTILPAQHEEAFAPQATFSTSRSHRRHDPASSTPPLPPRSPGEMPSFLSHIGFIILPLLVDIHRYPAVRNTNHFLAIVYSKRSTMRECSIARTKSNQASMRCMPTPSGMVRERRHTKDKLKASTKKCVIELTAALSYGPSAVEQRTIDRILYPFHKEDEAFLGDKYIQTSLYLMIPLLSFILATVFYYE